MIVRKSDHYQLEWYRTPVLWLKRWRVRAISPEAGAPRSRRILDETARELKKMNEEEFNASIVMEILG